MPERSVVGSSMPHCGPDMPERPDVHAEPRASSLHAQPWQHDGMPKGFRNSREATRTSRDEPDLVEMEIERLEYLASLRNAILPGPVVGPFFNSFRARDDSPSLATARRRRGSRSR